jgi:hypothetical protein
VSVRSEFVRLLDPVFNGRVYADEVARGGMDYPYAGVIDHVTEAVAMKGGGRVMAWRRLVQVDVWQRTGTEDPDLLTAVVDALDGVRVEGAYAVAVQSSLRTTDPDPGVVHHAVTCSVARPR